MANARLSQAQESIVALQAGLVGQVDIGVIVTPSLTLVPRAIAAVFGVGRVGETPGVKYVKMAIDLWFVVNVH